MNGLSMDPPRFREQHKQTNIAERIAGHAARELTRPAQLSSTAMAHIAARIEAQTTGSRARFRLGWVLVMGVLLLGMVTAASAAHLDLFPLWLSHIMQGKPKLASHEPTYAGGKARPSARKEHLPSPTTSQGVQSLADNLVTTGNVPAEGIVATDRRPLIKQEAKPIPRSRPSENGHAKPTALAMLGDGRRTPAALADHQPAPVVLFPSAVTEPAAPAMRADRVQAPAPFLPSETQPDRSQQVSSSLPSPPAPAPLHQTARSLKDIVRALRIDHSPSQALALLDRHASELAGNAFAEEALLLRVEAMLALGQRGAVLRLLDEASLSDVATSRVLLVTRGELRAAANRCLEGIGDFDLVLAESRRPPKQALLGRARCKQKLGDAAGAEADLDRYRREFPDSPLP